MNKKLKIIFSIVGSVILAYFLLSVSFYGSLNGWMSKCEYTEKVVAAPEELKGSVIVLDKSDAYVAKGKDPELCTPILSKIQNVIIDNKTIDNNMVGKEYFQRKGQGVEKLTHGKKFNFEKIIAETKHGLSAIDSGGGPIFFLVMRDDDEQEYTVAHPDLGFDEKESYLGYYKNGARLGSITFKYIEATVTER